MCGHTCGRIYDLINVMKITACIIILFVVVLHVVISQADNASNFEAMDIKVDALRNGVSHSDERLSPGFFNTRIIITPTGAMELKVLE